MEVNEDLARARSSATFDVEKLTEILYGGKDIVKRRRYFRNIIKNDKYLQSFKPWAYCTREEEHRDSIKKNVYVNQLIVDLGLDRHSNPADVALFRELANPNVANPIGIQHGMFIPAIQQQGTEEQKKKWLPLAENWKIIGTYAQTEMGHGTFIRGIETTATYDPKTEEFVLHSPTLTSMKFWPAGLGKSVNYSVVYAQLYTQGKCHGLHSFIAPLRSLTDHQPLPGVTVGDIGPKYGFNGNDNGFLIFDNYRIPRDYMLMRYAKVSKDGTYSKLDKPQLNYGVMMFVRAVIVATVGNSLSQACIIATRYSAVRRQTEIKPGGPEGLIIDYQTQQEKLFPQIATAYALYFCGRSMFAIYTRISTNIGQGDTAELPVIHALSAGLKAVCSWATCTGVDSLRMACGGHGYSHASGLPKIFINIAPSATYEGENTVMLLQTARYLVKCVASLQQGTPLPQLMSSLTTYRPGASSKLTGALELPLLVEAFEHNAGRLIISSAKKLQSLQQSGRPQEEAWNLSSVELTKAAMAFSKAFIVRAFMEAVTRQGLDPNVQRVLQTVFRLYAIHELNQKFGDYLIDNYLSASQVGMLAEKMLDLYAQIRPDAVALVDAFDIPDHVLQSALGRYDGQVYKALYEYAKNSPFNEKEVLDTYQESLRPLMKGEKPLISSVPAKL